jgi:polar amino acid transport system substrate-binding protein
MSKRPPTTRPRPRLLLALGAVLSLVLAACGGNGDTDPGGTEATDGETAAGGDLLAQLQERGVVKVGIANEVPYGYENEAGEVTGEAPEVARRVLQELGIEEIDAQVVDFGSLIGGLQAGQFDMIAAGMFINAERAEQILFSDPDYCVGEAFAVPEGNPQGLTDYQSVAENPDVTIAILSGAVEEGYAETAGVPDDQIELFTDVNAQYDALAAGRVDAVTGTSLTVRTQAEAREGIEATESFFPLDENGEEILGCGGFGFRFENQAFRDAFNDKLNELQEQGEILPIIEEFGFAPEDIERAEDLTVEDLTEQ